MGSSSGRAGASSPEARAGRRKLCRLYCWLYFSLGISCLVLGVIALFWTGLLSHGAIVHPDYGVQMIAAVLIVFGVSRMVQSLIVIRRC